MIEALAKMADVATELAKSVPEVWIDPDARVEATDFRDGANRKSDFNPDARIDSGENAEAPRSVPESEQAHVVRPGFDDAWRAWERFQGGDIGTSGNLPGTSLATFPMESARFKAYEYGLDKCREIAQHCFCPDVFEEWEFLSVEYRKEFASQYAAKIADALNIKLRGVRFEKCKDGVSGYTSGDGVIHLDNSLIQDPGNIVRLSDTVAHETRHVFQLEAIRNPHKYGIDVMTVREWEDAYETYGDNDDYSFYNPLGYYYNPLETDARAFGGACAQAIVRNWRTQNMA